MYKSANRFQQSNRESKRKIYKKLDANVTRDVFEGPDYRSDIVCFPYLDACQLRGDTPQNVPDDVLHQWIETKRIQHDKLKWSGLGKVFKPLKGRRATQKTKDSKL